MADDSSFGLPVRIFLSAILTILVVWLLATYLPQYFSLQGGLTAVVTVGSLLTLLNLLVRPLLNIITFPLRLFATLVAMILVNGGVLYLTVLITEKMQGSGIVLTIYGITGWLVVAVCLGFADWVLKHVLK